MEWIAQLKVGDTVYMVNKWGQRAPRTERVTKIGTKWIHIGSHERLSRVTGQLEDFGWGVFRDEGQYKHHQRIRSAWQRLRLFFDRPPPQEMTIERMEEIAKLAGVPWSLEPVDPESAPKKT